MSAAKPILDALREAVAFQPLGERAGNVSIGRGKLDGKPVRLALVENRFASGSLGAIEAERLVALFHIVAREHSPLVLFLDSAGAKVSEGLAALGGFRELFRAGLGAALGATPIAAVLGKNCYGGASMLAHLASRRLFSPYTQLAMSGPTILASSAGMDVLDEVFRAVAESSISASTRVKANPGANTVWKPGEPIADWLRAALVPEPGAEARFRAHHAALGERLPAEARTQSAFEAVHRRDIDHLYTAGYEARESSGILEGTGRTAEGAEAFVGILGKTPLGAERAWRFADQVWRHGAARPERLRVFLDCATHATRLDDEKIVLSEYIVDMSKALAVLAAHGTPVELTILGAAGGGVYVALAAPAKPVSAVHGADIQVLPGAALAAILGAQQSEVPDAAAYKAAGVADEELKLGLMP